MKGLEISTFNCREIYVGMTNVRARTKNMSLKSRVFMTEKDVTKRFRT